MSVDQEKWDKALLYYDRGERQSALFLFRRLYDEGHKAAARMIAAIYEENSSNDDLQDYKKAYQWNEKLAYGAGDIMGYVGLARAHFYGLGVPKDNVKALSFLEELEHHEHHIIDLLKGKIFFEEERYTVATKFLNKSKEQGNIVAILYLSELYRRQGKFIKAKKYKLIGIIKGFFSLTKNEHSEYANDL